MSIFKSTPVACPACETPVQFELVHSVNAERRPDLRDAVLDGSFQLKQCPACSYAFRVQPELTYTDLGRGQFIAVWPVDFVSEWSHHEQRSLAAFAAAFGEQAPAAAREAGCALQPRVVFGWPALEEKLQLQDAGIDDTHIELAKVAVLRTLAEVPLGPALELRLVGHSDEQLVLAWIHTASETPQAELVLPRSLLEDIVTAAGELRGLREKLSAGPFVDYRRLLLG